MQQIKVVTRDFLDVFITKSDSDDAAPVERRFNKGITISEFKTKLELVTGGAAATMKLQVFDSKNNLVCAIDDDSALLGSYHIEDGMRIHVTDKFTLLKDFTDSDTDERFKLSEEAYQQKQDTLRAFLQKNKLGKYNEEEMKQLKLQQEAEAQEEAKLASAIPIDARCEVRVPNQPSRRATVMYKGPLEGTGRNGTWIGVKYDEPLGKNDGSVEGRRYFTCQPKYGGFVKPIFVTVGDYPVEEFDLDDEI